MEDIYLEEEKVNFDKKVRGSFGDFETNVSYELDYLMATIDIGNIADLKIASSVLDFNETKFEELVQRDIDYKRVEEDIIENYLEQGKDKFIFFPPLLVSPIITDKKGKIIDTFDEIKSSKNNREYIRIYDDNIQIKFPIYNNPPKDYPYYITEENGEKIFFHNYATTFEYNSQNVNLVVIDGQHRLIAIKNLLKRNPEIIENIKIPICIFFAPNALSGSNITLTKSMRQLFVIINSTAKQVSGHFITLLSDDSLSSFIIREFADNMKSKNKLHLVEWNERSDRRASLLNKKYSITTIKIIDDALKDYVLKPSLTHRILNLSSIKQEETTSNKVTYLEFDNNNFFIDKDIGNQIEKLIVPSLELLFLDPKPYKIKEQQLEKAFDDLDKKIKIGKKGANSFKSDVLNEYREYQERFDVNSVAGIQDEFLEFFEENDNYSFYYKNIFQQGYIKAWSDIFDLLSKNQKNKIDLIKFTKTFIDSIQEICFNEDKNLFNYTKEYTQNVLYKNSKINVNKTSKEQVANLIISIFLNKKAISKFKKEIGTENNELDLFAKRALKSYFNTYKNKNIIEMQKNWRNMLDSEDKLYLILDELDRNINIEENQTKFESIVLDYVSNNTKKAKTILANVLEIDYEDTNL